jgi:hypothetical protein
MNLPGFINRKWFKKISKDAFNEEIDFLGADINFYSGGAYAMDYLNILKEF